MRELTKIALLSRQMRDNINKLDNCDSKVEKMWLGTVCCIMRF